MKRFTDIVGLISSLISIFNVLLALPSVFKDIDSSYLVEITNKNFALRLGFILILQFAVGYVLSISITSASRSRVPSNIVSVGLLSILVTCWLTFFNISEILYLEKLSSTAQHFGMLFFILLTLLVQSIQILSSQWNSSYYDVWYASTAEEYKKIQDEKSYFGGKLFFIGVLAFFQIVFFCVYWLN